MFGALMPKRRRREHEMKKTSVMLGMMVWLTANAVGCLQGGMKQVGGATFALSPLDFAMANALEQQEPPTSPDVRCEYWRSKLAGAAQMEEHHAELKRWIPAKERDVCSKIPPPPTFCAVERRETPAARCEDFMGIEEGQIPAGWQGGQGLMVGAALATPGRRFLASYEPRNAYSVTIPWRVVGNYDIKVQLRTAELYDRRLTVRVGTVQFKLGQFWANFTVEINDRRQENLHTASPVATIILRRTGSTSNLFKVIVDGTEAMTTRVDGVPLESPAVVLDADHGGIAIAGISLRAP